MKQLSNRGAARIGAVWMIVVIVLFFVAMAYAYVANQAATQSEDARAAAVSARSAAVDELDVARLATVNLSEKAGFRDSAVSGSLSDLGQIDDAVESLRNAFALPDSINTLEGTVNPVISKYNAEQAKVQTLNSQIAALRAQIQANDAAASTTAANLQGQINTLTKEKADEAQNLNDQITSLEGDLVSMTDNRNSLDDDLNTEKGGNDALVLQMAEERSNATNLAAGLQDLVEEVQKRAQTPDGKILAVSKELGIGWINRGTIDRVTEGMRFEVVTGHPNPTGASTKAMCEVLRVLDHSSEVKIYDEADPFDPVVTDDVLYNPIYDPNGTRNAVLVGRFGGTYNEAEIALLLGEIGITVQQDLDLTTNYLIVGQPMYIDENGEPLDEPRQPSELVEYKEAQAQGCSIFSVNEFREFFKR